MDGKEFSVADKVTFEKFDLYASLFEYSAMHPRITYGEFENDLLRDVCLFNVPNDEYMEEVERTLDLMIATLPAMKRVFARPIIRLKDHHSIVPIEAVKVIDNQSITHASSRSEMWDDITDEGIKPRKLMTLEHVETYAIYENIAFAYAVDSMLAYIKKTLVRIKDVVYGCRDIHFNLLDRTHHNLYFLAIGKLYLEYVNTRSDQENWSRCVEKMMFIDRTLRGKLKSPVYQHCKRRSYNLKLKKTNIFRSHKDYAEIYKLLKAFEDGVGINDDDSLTARADKESFKTFCKLLTVFAVGHFNYTVPKFKKIDMTRFSLDGSFKNWNVKVTEVNDRGIGALIFTTRKDVEYTTCMIFSESEASSTALEDFRKRHPADEYLTCSPNIHGDRSCVYLSIYDIDSFRRIQQILLRGMIRSDTKREECAFCGGTLTEEGGAHVCHFCGAEIKREVCPITEKIYYSSGILSSRLTEDSKKSVERKFLHDRLSEARLHFRNITHITSDGKAVCPYCDKPHAET